MTDTMVTEGIMYRHQCAAGLYAGADFISAEEKAWMTARLGKRIRITFEVVEEGPDDGRATHP